MRTLGLIALVLGLLVVTAALSPGVTWGVSALLDRQFTFGRVYNRVFEVLLVIGLIVTWRRLDLGSLGAIGFRRRRWAQDLGRGLVWGLVGLGLALVVCLIAGGLDPALRYPAAKTVQKALLGLAAAVAIGVGEEALFRGVLLRRIGRDFGTAVGVILTTAIYAAVHAIGKGGKTPGVTAWSGVERTAVLFRPLTEGSAVPELAGLALLGLLLAALRLQSGGLWLPIGVHASWVAIFRVGRLFFEIERTPAWLVGAGWPPLIGGAAGWLAVGVTAYLLLGRRRRLP